MSDSVTRWLEQLDLGEYAVGFAENDIDTELLLQLTDDDLKALGAEVKDGFKNLEKRLGKLDDATSKADADLRTAILEHTKTVTAQLKKVSDEFSSELQQAVMELRGEKLDTATLIQLFSDMALHLTEDLQAGPEND